MARTAARDAAFRLLYERELGGEGGLSGLLEMTESTLSGDDRAYIDDVLLGESGHEAEIDDGIARYAKGWEIDRLSRIDLSLLRLAVYELLYRDDIPASVTINEVVQLAHTYSSDEAPVFINGVLGAFARAEGVE